MNKYNYFVYIMSSFRGVLYIGVTNNLERRVEEHKNAQIKGFSQKYNINKLIYFEEYNNINDALEREKELKSWRREKKIQLIDNLNSEWADLAFDTG